MPLVSGVVVFVFGALTLYLQDDVFIKMKPTIVNTLFGVVLLGGLFFGKSLLGYVFDSAFKLDAEGWRKLTLRWGLFFLFLAVRQRGRLAQFLDRYLGDLQGLGHHADHLAVHLQPDAADHAPFARRAGRQIGRATALMPQSGCYASRALLQCSILFCSAIVHYVIVRLIREVKLSPRGGR